MQHIQFKFDYCTLKLAKVITYQIAKISGITIFFYQMEFVSFSSNTTGVTSEPGTVCLSEVLEFTLDF
jgi:hypothetical protein